VNVTIGSKFEVNEYTGLEIQPSAHVAWTTADQEHTWWGGVSRAVRTPTRTDADLSLTVAFAPGTPTFARILGSDDFRSEEVLAYQAGYRGTLRPWLSFDATAFYHDYSNLLSLEAGAPFAETDPPPPRTVVPFVDENLVEGESYGFELASRFRPSERVHLTLNYSLLHFELAPDPGSTDPTTDATETSAPRHQALLWTSVALPSNFTADGVLRYVSELTGQQVPAYTELDLQIEWRAQPGLRFALLGKNLLHDHHAEFGPPLHRVEVERSLVGRVTWTW
jgi:iron complex outermembrane receptor protein